MAEEIVIEVKGLTKRYGPVLAVDSLTLQVPRGGVFGLLGPNGSGKTTTMSILLDLVRPTSGTVTLFGEPSDHPSQEALRRVGAIVETPAFYPNLSGRDNLRYFQGIIRRGSEDEVDRLLTQVGLGARARSKFRTYSLGMKQRLGIAYALLGDPELLILDEPTNGLDPAGMAEVRELIQELASGGRTILLSSHLLHEAEQVCDRVAILSQGRLIAEGPVKELLHQKEAMRLKTTNDAKATEVISSLLPWVSGVISQDGYLLVTARRERWWEITAALSAQGVYVGELIPVQMSLEQYFLAVTEDHVHPKKEVIQ